MIAACGCRKSRGVVGTAKSGARDGDVATSKVERMGMNVRTVTIAAVASVFAAVVLVLVWPDDGVQSPLYEVPADVASDCSEPVDSEIARFIDTVPDGGTVVFARNACYGHDGELQVNDRIGLTLDGNGSMFKPLTTRPDECRATWRIQAGADIHLRNMTVRGLNTTGFDGPRHSGVEGQCHSAFSFDSVQGASLVDSKAFDSLADPLAIQPDRRAGGDYCAVPPNRNIVIDRFEAHNAGRTVAVTNVDSLVIQNSSFRDIYDSSIDIETDVGCEWSRNVHILNNRFGRSHHGMVIYTGGEPPERSGGLEVIGNVMELEPDHCFVPISIAPFQYSPGQVRRSVVIRDNRLITHNHGISLADVGDAVVEGNVVTKNYGTGCTDETFAVTVRGSDNVRVSGNEAIGGPLGSLDGELAIDPASTDISYAGAPGTLLPAASSGG